MNWPSRGGSGTRRDQCARQGAPRKGALGTSRGKASERQRCSDRGSGAEADGEASPPFDKVADSRESTVKASGGGKPTERTIETGKGRPPVRSVLSKRYCSSDDRASVLRVNPSSEQGSACPHIEWASFAESRKKAVDVWDFFYSQLSVEFYEVVHGRGELPMEMLNPT